MKKILLRILITGSLVFNLTAQQKDKLFEIKANLSGDNKGFIFGFMPDWNFTFSKIHSTFSPLDDLIQFKNPAVTLSNLDKIDQSTIFDVEPFDDGTAKINPKLDGVLTNIPKGITIIGEAEFTGVIGKVLGAAGAKTLQTRINIPKDVKKTNVEIFNPKEEEHSICMKDIINAALGSNVPTGILGDTCLIGKKIDIKVDKDRASLVYGGAVQLFGKRVEADLWLSRPMKQPTESDIALRTYIGDLDLSKVRELGPLASILGLIKFRNSNVIYSTNNNDLELAGEKVGDKWIPVKGVKTQKGLTIYANLDFQGFLGTVLDKIGLGSLKTSVTVPLNPADVEQFSLLVTKDINGKVGDIIDFKTLTLGIRGKKGAPDISADIDSIFKFPGTDPLELIFKGTIDPTTGSFALDGSVIGKPLNNPFGIPLKLEDPNFKVGFTAGVLTEVGAGGKLDIAGEKVELASDLDIVHPWKSALMGSAENVKLTLIDVIKSLLPGLKDLNIPDIIKIDKLEISVAAFPTKVRDKDIPMGVFVHATINILGAKGYLDLTLDPLHLTFSGKGSCDKIDLLGIAKLTSHDESTGPSFTVDTSGIKIDGKFNLLGGVFKTDTELIGTIKGLSFEQTGQVLGIEGTTKVTIPVPRVDQGTFTFGFSSESFNDYVKNRLDDHINTAREEAKSNLTTAQDAVNSVSGKCGSIPVISDACKGIFKVIDTSFDALKGATDLTLQGINAIGKEIGKLSLKAELSGDFEAIEKGGNAFKFKVTGRLLGKDIDITINIPFPSEIGELGKKIGDEIYETIIHPDINKILNNLKALGNGIGDSVKDAYNYLKDPNNYKELAIAFANKVKDLAVDAANTVADLATHPGKILDFASDTGKKVLEVAGPVVDLAKQTGEKIADFAKQGWSEVSKIGEKIGEGVTTAAKETGKALETGAEAVAGAAEETGKAIETGAEAALSGLETGAEAALSGFETAGEAISGTAEAAWSGIESGAEAAWSGIQSGAEAVWSGLETTGKAIEGGLETAGKTIASGAKEAWHAATSWL